MYTAPTGKKLRKASEKVLKDIHLIIDGNCNSFHDVGEKTARELAAMLAPPVETED